MSNLDLLLNTSSGIQHSQFVVATVTQVSPLLIRLDGDTDALPFTPHVVTSVGNIAVGVRVLCSIVNGQLVVMGSLGTSGTIDNGRYIRKSGGNPYTISNMPCAATSGLNWALAAVEADMNGVIVSLPAQATVTMPTNTTRWYFLDYNITTGAASLVYDSTFSKADTSTHKYLPLCRVVSTTSITGMVNIVSWPNGQTFALLYLEAAGGSVAMTGGSTRITPGTTQPAFIPATNAMMTVHMSGGMAPASADHCYIDCYNYGTGGQICGNFPHYISATAYVNMCWSNSTNLTAGASIIQLAHGYRTNASQTVTLYTAGISGSLWHR